MNPDVRCRFTETDEHLDTDPSAQLRVTALSENDAKLLAADSSSCFIKHRR